MKRFAFVGLLLLTALLVLAGCSSLTAARPDENGVVNIVLKDYAIEPRTIRVKAGQRVSLVISNQGEHLHELMIGRNVRIEGDFTEGFSEDFFAGITPEVQGPGMIMGLEGMEMGGMDMGGDGHDEGKDKGMDMGGDSGQMDMGGDGHDGGGDGHGEGAGGKFGPVTLDAIEEGHGGLMVMIDPTMVPKDQVTILTFTVPEDKVGEWEMGCFQERGQHYDDGMKGVLIVES